MKQGDPNFISVIAQNIPFIYSIIKSVAKY